MRDLFGVRNTGINLIIPAFLFVRRLVYHIIYYRSYLMLETLNHISNFSSVVKKTLQQSENIQNILPLVGISRILISVFAIFQICLPLLLLILYIKRRRKCLLIISIYSYLGVQRCYKLLLWWLWVHLKVPLALP